MKKILPVTLIILLTPFLSFYMDAQEIDSSSSKLLRNNINVYVGLIEANVNYERNILQRPKFHTNLRLGFGTAMFLTAGIGKYVNPSIVQIFGKGSSHIGIGGKF